MPVPLSPNFARRLPFCLAVHKTGMARIECLNGRETEGRSRLASLRWEPAWATRGISSSPKRVSSGISGLVEAQPLLLMTGCGRIVTMQIPEGDPAADLRADGGSISPCLQRGTERLYASS